MCKKIKNVLSCMLIMVIIISMIPKMVLATENQNKSSQLGDIIEEGNYIITSKQSNKAIEVANYGG